MRGTLFLCLILWSFGTTAQNYNYLGNYTSNGTPLYLEPFNDVITPSIFDMLAAIVPEGFPVPDYNPHYISAGYDTDIILDQAADVWVTFVQEGAGYKNVLGFYTYDIQNPPSSAPTAADITIIYPNVSAIGSGGGLQAGNKVKIGSFPAQTGIGWVLIANGWNSSQSSVGNGAWKVYSNPNFNPEANPDLRHHNVLIKDEDNQRIILGFEDVRRDYASCDNDFNDALFYVTANPYAALKTSNYADVSSASDVSSANLGGLESHGGLARLIAKRNFKRQQTNSFAHKKHMQTQYSRKTTQSQTNANPFAHVGSLLPQTGMMGTEHALTSTPTDLLDITNAVDVAAVDYYQGSNRVAAALVTKTLDSVYSHSKMICDRLNGSRLEDIRSIRFQGHQLIMLQIKRSNNQIEYAVLFSIAREIQNQYKLHSYWNISDYPINKDYLNFQVWGTQMGQVSHITQSILNVFSSSNLTSTTPIKHVPHIFVKNASYQNGLINLTLINKSGDTQLNLSAQKRLTELSNQSNINQQITLTGNREETISLNWGYLFDAGLSLQTGANNIPDALYLADGPWGLDYLNNDTQINQFNITPETGAFTTTPGEYKLERQVYASGTTKGTANIFRNILPGEQFFDARGYSNINFNLACDLPVEVILVTEGLQQWSERLRYSLISPTTTGQDYSIDLNQFTNPQGHSYQGEAIKSVVFSLQGNYQTFQAFSVSIKQIVFSDQALGITDDFAISNKERISCSPNPFQETTQLQFTEKPGLTSIQVYSISGKKVYEGLHQINQKNIELQLKDLKSGLYLCKVATPKKIFTLKLVVE